MQTMLIALIWRMDILTLRLIRHQMELPIAQQIQGQVNLQQILQTANQALMRIILKMVHLITHQTANKLQDCSCL